jgi:hypothetical protein
MKTTQPGSSGPATPKNAESNRNVKDDAGDLDPRDTAHPTGQAQAEKNGGRITGLICW